MPFCHERPASASGTRGPDRRVSEPAVRSLWLAPHPPQRRPVRGIAAFLDYLEAVAFVKRAVASARGLEIGRHAVRVAALEHGSQEGGAEAAAVPLVHGSLMV